MGLHITQPIKKSGQAFFFCLPRGEEMKLDKIGIWSEIKLEIVRNYASAYTKILSKKDWCRGYIYIDAFAGAGLHLRKETGEFVHGSPLNALKITPPFTEYHFIDLDEDKVESLKKITKGKPDIHFYHGDCNEILIKDIFPKLTYDSFKRALCIFDPYGLGLKWETIKKGADLKTVDIFLNFSIMDANRNVLFEDLSMAKQEDIGRMSTFWGDTNWKELIYKEEKDLFGEARQIKVDNFKRLALGFRERLRKVAGFKHVPEPVLMRNTKNGPLYYLYFASQQDVANNIINDIFNKYRRAL